ncbi:FAD-dependent monooxygenase, partial [Kitasatospora phosalacinea]|uniref:FAD-dependent monooxygenase n=1 Tax=Kitasatospora phosalacinea TaxID=2065 RepID=UPI0035D879F4
MSYRNGQSPTSTPGTLPPRLPGPARRWRGSRPAPERSPASWRSGRSRPAPGSCAAPRSKPSARTATAARGGGRAYRARRLVGCDGRRSTVRRPAGFDFVGAGPPSTGYAAHVALAAPEKLRPGFRSTPTGTYLRTPFAGRPGTAGFDGGAFDRSRPLPREHLQAVLRRLSGSDVTIDGVHLASGFTGRAVQAGSYRKGRVLLDTCTAGRRPVGAAVLDRSRAQVPGRHDEPRPARHGPAPTRPRPAARRAPARPRPRAAPVGGG